MDKFCKGVAVAMSLALVCSCSTGDAETISGPELAVSATGQWQEFEHNPVIKYGDVLPGILWNDASVIKEDGRYRMWLTGGLPFDVPIVVKVYEAVSDDGINWDINPTPVLEPGQSGEWDDLRTETPSVIKVGDTYHLYYSGCKTPCMTGKYSIGHATSTDGTNWVKDPNNPVITYHDDPLRWGFYAAAEPAVVFHKGTFFLYFASARSNYPEYGTPFGITLATSKDGSSFAVHGAAHTLSKSYDARLFRGYSTPMVYMSDGIFHLYHGVVYSPDGPDGFDQIAISTATSKDGFEFEEASTNIARIEPGWKRVAVLSPAVIEESDRILMWFAAQTDKPQFSYGIGLTVLKK